jgi:mannose-6-phosphate isomerase-like protein (cupin superfamily)
LIEVDKPPTWPEGLPVLDSIDVESHVLANAGARPWERDHDDVRVLYFVAEGRGQIVNDEKDLSAYPKQKPTRAAFNEGDWDLATMEPKSGLYPGQKKPIVQPPREGRGS